MQRRKYEKHIFKTVEEIVRDFEEKATVESRLMYDTLKPTIALLEEHYVSKLVNVVKLLKNSGLGSKVINKMISYLNKSLGKPKLSNRQNKKFNASYQNLMFTSFFVDCPDNTYKFMEQYISDNNLPADNSLIEQIKQKVQCKLVIPSFPMNSEFQMNHNIQVNEIQHLSQVKNDAQATEFENYDISFTSQLAAADPIAIKENVSSLNHLINEDDYYEDNEDFEPVDYYFM